MSERGALINHMRSGHRSHTLWGPGKVFFRLLFNKRDLFYLSVPNSEEWTDFTLGSSFTLPPHSVKHSCSILSADLSILTQINTPAAVYANTSAKSLSLTELLVSVGSNDLIWGQTTG